MSKINSNPSRAAQLAAHLAVTLACRQGVIKRAKEMACVDCGRPAAHYDHRDYSKPLEVEPVCGKCNSLRGPARGHVLVSPRGRPANPPEARTKPYSVRLTNERIEKLKKLGSAWLNKAIDSAN